jgi:(p)ppGpp synthase/HD superfamily hydrolase
MTTLPQRARDARAFADAAHGEQRYGADRYVVHLDEVVAILLEYGWEHEDALCGGLLHDVLEDTEVTEPELRARFGDRVTAITAFCTDEPGKSRAVRKERTYARMGRQLDAGPEWGAEAAAVKLADRLANVRRCVLDGDGRQLGVYQREHPALTIALGGDAAHAAMWRELDGLLAG